MWLPLAGVLVECLGDEVRHDVGARVGDHVACCGDRLDGRGGAGVEDRALGVGEADLVLFAVDHPGPCTGLAQPAGNGAVVVEVVQVQPDVPADARGSFLRSSAVRAACRCAGTPPLSIGPMILSMAA